MYHFFQIIFFRRAVFQNRLMQNIVKLCAAVNYFTNRT